jgi:hypothetical protein
MKIDEDEASNSVKTSIEAHRTDVLKAVIDTIKKGLTIVAGCHLLFPHLSPNSCFSHL